jgi:hypothetical protein
MMILLAGCADKDGKIIVKISDTRFKSYLLEHFDKNGDGNLSLAEAKEIKEINCRGMEIENLDGIEKFENLESLDCSNNKLDELEIRYNRKLNKLVCTGNNMPLMLYIGMKSPLRNTAIQKPKNNEPPQSAIIAASPLDDSKVIYDRDKTNIILSFDD